MVALAGSEPAIARVESLPVASSADELLAERVVLAVIAAIAGVLVPGHAERLIDSPLTWADLAGALRRQRRHRARVQMTPGW